MRIRDRKLFGIPLTAILIVAAIFAGGIYAALYWTSPDITWSVGISGWIDACTNFDWSDLADNPTYATLESRCVQELIPNGGNYILRIASEGANAQDCYATLNIVCPGESTATAKLAVVEVVNGILGAGVILEENVATDGSQSVKVVKNGDDNWFYTSTYGGSSSRVKVIYFIITLNVAPGLPIGTHVFLCSVGLSDSL